MSRVLAAVLGLALVACHGHSHRHGGHSHSHGPRSHTHDWSKPKKKAVAKDPEETVPRCPVSGEAASKKVFIELDEGDRVYFCCESCLRKYVAEPERYSGS